MKKLDEETVQKMRKMYYVDNAPIKQVMSEFNVPYTTAYDVCGYITWHKVPDIFSPTDVMRF